ncbi:MAG TPA: GHMP kinase [Nitrospinota bacterium]|jgi:D-glycero-alpha-D-manno-heptose-7-phosphate kinase|nr:GHMP kinase [Nitrospinota bacterium]HJN02468.1 GHMP kinase [Nitrospinota bacterium]|tara:strand:- start:17 stop:1009 length:993 start_codon:yes stop_codon:yes gene_type:complete
MIIESKAPTRIDLAGGTIDIWPLYLFHHGAVTINAAINLYATVKLTPRDDKKIIIESKDQGKRVNVASINKLNAAKGLELITELIRFYSPKQGFHLITDCAAPAGSGIGGSSSLNIALNSTLNRFTDNRYSKKEILTIAKNIEARVIGVPTGEQDYYPALFGGVNIIRLEDKGVTREKINIHTKELERRLILCFTGKPRASGTNNWQIMKKHIDGDKALYQKMESIKQTALKMGEALAKNRFDIVGQLLNEEWDNRKKLSKNVTTLKIEKIIKSAFQKGATAAKVCGAGGGGCLVLFVPPDKKKVVEKIIQLHRCKILPFNITPNGLFGT